MVKYTPSDLTEEVRDPFIGKIIYAKYEPLKEEFQTEDVKEQLHIKIAPMSRYDVIQHQWLRKAKWKRSAWGQWILAFHKLGLTFDDEKLEGLTFEFEDKVIMKKKDPETGDAYPVTAWVPARIPKDEEIKDLEIRVTEEEEEEIEVEEIDIE